MPEDAVFAPPPRPGPRPKTPHALPHIQLDQRPPREIAQELIVESLRLEGVRAQQSRMASPRSQALCLPECLAGGPTDAFIDNREFCHLHPLPEGTVHLTLPNPLRELAIELGWGEQHPAARCGIMPRTLTTVYAPRNSFELSVVLHLIWSSCQFARGMQFENLHHPYRRALVCPR